MDLTQTLIGALAFSVAALVYLFWLRPKVRRARIGAIEARRRLALSEAFPSAASADMLRLKEDAELLARAEGEAVAAEARLRSHAFTQPKAAAPDEPTAEVFARLAESVKKDSPALKLAELALNLRAAAKKYKKEVKEASALLLAPSEPFAEQAGVIASAYDVGVADASEVDPQDFVPSYSEGGADVLTDAPFDGHYDFEGADSLLATAGQSLLDLGGGEHLLAPVLHAPEGMDQAVSTMFTDAGIELAAGDAFGGAADAASGHDASLDIPYLTLIFSLQREITKLFNNKLSAGRALGHVAIDASGVYFGAKFGALVGALGGPLGAVIGGFVGGFLGAKVGGKIKALPLTGLTADLGRLREEASASAQRSSHQALLSVGEVVSKEREEYLREIDECPKPGVGARRRELESIAEELSLCVEQAVGRARVRLYAAIDEARALTSDRWYHRLAGLAVDGVPSAEIGRFRVGAESCLNGVMNKAVARASKAESLVETINEISGHPAQKYLRDVSGVGELDEALRRVSDSYAGDVRRWKAEAVSRYVRGRRSVRRAYEEEVRRHNALYDSYKLKAEEIGRAMLKELEALGKA